jgi:hypothetical protein
MMEWRELEYYLLLFRLYQQPPLQYVLYFGAGSLTMQRSINHSGSQFRYTLGLEDAAGKALEQGEHKALRRLIEHRFGPLSEAIYQRLQALSQTEIEAAILRVLDAKQIEDVLAQKPN